MSTGICIVWPAWFLGSTDEQLHCTTIFLGSTEDTEIKRADIEDALLWTQTANPGPIKVTGTALYGAEKNVPVLTLDPEKLVEVQQGLTDLLAFYGIVSASEFGFSPHVTIAKEVAKPYFPNFIQLEAPVLWWGDDRPLHTKHQPKVEYKHPCGGDKCRNSPCCEEGMAA